MQTASIGGTPMVQTHLLSELFGTPTLGQARAIDFNPHPRIFETFLVAKESTATLDSSGLQANVYTFNGKLPGPMFKVKVGDRVIVHFRNELSVPTTIHWHGIELNNFSDGTGVTQNEMMTGDTYTYDFFVPRPGVFWYHTHILPTNQNFKGMYGAFISTDRDERRLAFLGVLPKKWDTYTLMLSDITVCKTPGQNDTATFEGGADIPWAGGSPFPGNSAFPTPEDLCEEPRDNKGNPTGGPDLQAGDVPNVVPPEVCRDSNSGGGATQCRVNEGQLVLTNGRVPAARAGSPDAPGALAPGAKPVPVKPGAGVRLKMLNAAIIRYFRLRLTDQNGAQIPLIRVGGEGGLLDAARTEGGTQDILDTEFDPGEILLAPANRADVVAVIPETAQHGDILTLWTLDYEHTGRNPAWANIPTVPVLHFKVSKRGKRFFKKRPFSIDDSTPLLTNPFINDPVENLKNLPITDFLIDPATLAAPNNVGSDNPRMTFTNTGGVPSVDGIAGIFDGGVMDDFENIPRIETSRYARVGDLLELEISNETRAHHPFHMHGFSIQPVEMIRNSDDAVVNEYTYNEFVDTVDIPNGHRLKFRVQLDDRPLPGDDIDDLGGAIGRWVFHCHIFSHAHLGMIAELVVLEAAP